MNKLVQGAVKVVRKAGAAVVTTVATATAAMAQTTDPVVQAFTDLGTKVTAYGGAIVTFAIIGVGFAIGVKYVKKAPRAS